ncbi:hypothetical protein DRJ17_06245 [Candidatus Woesearchaeota archaeon]|nr:MAG: hypothetical protein DRJ17_06245 [Candidatus Woesearchaeota archaeon]
MKENDNLNYKEVRVFKLRGNSMWPFIKDGDIVIVEPTEINNIFLGQIVLAEEGGVFFCHRLFKKKGEFFQTKADTFFGLDPLLEERNLLGKVIAIKRRGKIIRIDRRLHYFMGFFILWFTFFISPFYYILRRLRKIGNNVHR